MRIALGVACVVGSKLIPGLAVLEATALRRTVAVLPPRGPELALAAVRLLRRVATLLVVTLLVVALILLTLGRVPLATLWGIWIVRHVENSMRELWPVG